MNKILTVFGGLLLGISFNSSALTTPQPYEAQIFSRIAQTDPNNPAQLNAILSQYQFGEARPLSDFRPFSHNGYTVRTTYYKQAEEEVFPLVFLIQKNNHLVAFISADQAGPYSKSHPIAGDLRIVYFQTIPKNEQMAFEEWFEQWLNSVN